MKIYTKTGDAGTTSLVGGKRVPKSDVRLEAYGTVDELNAFIGDLINEITDAEDKKLLIFIQNKLFVVGSKLACEEESNIKLPGITHEDIEKIEKRIDTIETTLPKHNKFILPGGTPAACKAHICRTVARRAERNICRLAEQSKVDAEETAFINRLSDYFFVLSRHCNISAGNTETYWGE